MHQKIWGLKEELVHEMSTLNGDHLEELVQHRQRVYEVGE